MNLPQIPSQREMIVKDQDATSTTTLHGMWAWLCGLGLVGGVFVLGGGLTVLLFHMYASGVHEYEAWWLISWFLIVICTYAVLGQTDVTMDDDHAPLHVQLQKRLAKRIRRRRRSRTVSASESEEISISIDDPAPTVSNEADNDNKQEEKEDIRAVDLNHRRHMFNAETVIAKYEKTEWWSMMMEPKPIAPRHLYLPYVCIQVFAILVPFVPCFFRVASGEPFAGTPDTATGRFIVTWNILVSPFSIHFLLTSAPGRVLAKLRGLQLMARHLKLSIEHIQTPEQLKMWNNLAWDLRAHATRDFKHNSRQFLSVIVLAFAMSVVLIAMFFFTPNDSLRDPLWIQIFMICTLLCVISLFILWRAARVDAAFRSAYDSLVVIGIQTDKDVICDSFYDRISNYWATSGSILHLRLFNLFNVNMGNKFSILFSLLLSNAMLFSLKSLIVPFVESYNQIGL